MHGLSVDVLFTRMNTETVLELCTEIKILEPDYEETVPSVADVNAGHLQPHRLSLQVNASDPLKEMLAFSSRDR